MSSQVVPERFEPVTRIGSVRSAASASAGLRISHVEDATSYRSTQPETERVARRLGLGCVYWSDIAVWVAIPTSIVCGLFLPAAYVGFCLLQRSRKYLGADRPAGVRGGVWLAAMIGVTLFLMAFLGWYVVQNLRAIF